MELARKKGLQKLELVENDKVLESYGRLGAGTCRIRINSLPEGHIKGPPVKET